MSDSRVNIQDCFSLNEIILPQGVTLLFFSPQNYCNIHCYCCQQTACFVNVAVTWPFSLWCRKGSALCERSFALHCQQPERSSKISTFPPWKNVCGRRCKRFISTCTQHRKIWKKYPYLMKYRKKFSECESSKIQSTNQRKYLTIHAKLGLRHQFLRNSSSQIMFIRIRWRASSIKHLIIFFYQLLKRIPNVQLT